MLPSLYKPAETLETALAQMAAAVVRNTNDSKLAREEKLARDQVPKLPSEMYNVAILQEYIQIPDK